MDPLDAPARLPDRLLESDDDADASTPIARVAGQDTPPLYSLYGTSSIFVRVDDIQEESEEPGEQSGEQSGEQTGKHVEDQREPAVMIVPVAALVRPSTGGCLPVCATVSFFVLLVATTCLFIVPHQDTPGANITPV